MFVNLSWKTPDATQCDATETDLETEIEMVQEQARLLVCHCEKRVMGELLPLAAVAGRL